MLFVGGRGKVYAIITGKILSYQAFLYIAQKSTFWSDLGCCRPSLIYGVRLIVKRLRLHDYVEESISEIIPALSLQDANTIICSIKRFPEEARSVGELVAPSSEDEASHDDDEDDNNDENSNEYDSEDEPSSSEHVTDDEDEEEVKQNAQEEAAQEEAAQEEAAQNENKQSNDEQQDNINQYHYVNAIDDERE